jgi:hypothetical protein
MKLATTIALCLAAARQAAAFQEWIDATIAHEGDPVGEEIDYDGCKTHLAHLDPAHILPIL